MAVLKIIEESISEHYSDGDRVECEILEYAGGMPSDDYSAILAKDQRWPVFYHLSDMREDILNWYDFAPGCDVLEIGAGMGALTGLLCRSAGSVTSVELTLPRARVIQERCKQYDNLTILVGNFNRMEFPQQYDYITLIGVLEYAPGFTEGGDPADFLRRIRGLLKPGGKLLLAIENRFGLKYWCGVGEDHTGEPFSGINGYPGVSQIRTYSRSELSHMLSGCGFEKQKFYYPLPDYKFPQVLYSDEYYPQNHLPGKIRMYRSVPQTMVAEEEKLYPSVFENGAFPYMANSFFVECGTEEIGLSPVSAAFFAPDRMAEKRLITLISVNEKMVEKKAAVPAAKTHLLDILKTQSTFQADNLIPYSLLDDRLRMPYLTGVPFEQILYDLFRHGEFEKAIHWIDRFYACIKEASGADPQETDPVLNEGFVDMVFQNCFVQEESLIFFDQEWVLRSVPASFILFRAVGMFYSEYPELQEYAPISKIHAHYGFSADTAKAYEELDREFAKENIQQASNPLTILDTFCKGKAWSSWQYSLYYNLGAGYSETQMYRSAVPADRIIDMEWSLPDGCVSVRFDPVEGHCCIVRNLEVSSDRTIASVSNLNGQTRDSVEFFQNTDPQIEIVFSEPAASVRIRASLSVYDDPLLAETLTDTIISAEKKEKEYENQLAVTENQLAVTENQLAVTENQLAAAQEAFDAISNSFFWKLTKPLRSVKDLLYRVPAFQSALKDLKNRKGSN